MMRWQIAYPIISSLVAAALVFYLFPGFAETYSEAGGALPPITQFAIDASDSAYMIWWGALFVVVALAIVFLASVRAIDSSPESRDLSTFGATAVIGAMLAVSGFFVAAIVFPMLSQVS